jgi:hypothetical protein
MRRGAAWLAATVLIVLAARTFAYAVEPSPLARALEQQAGGPRLWTLALAVLVGGVAVAAAVVWLATLGVEERRRLERRRVLEPPARPRAGLLLGRATALSLASSTGFVLLESTLHWRAGLGWHGLACLTGPVHRDAIPMLVALSLLAAACAAALELVLAWMRRTLARLAAVLPLPMAAAPRLACAFPALVAVGSPLGARGPPSGSS